MATVPYTNPAAINVPSSSSIAYYDDFFGFNNPIQAINSIAPNHRNSDGTIQQPAQVITVNSGAVPPDMSFFSSGGRLFDMRPPNEIFAEMDARLNQQRQNILNSPRFLKMFKRQ